MSTITPATHRSDTLFGVHVLIARPERDAVALAALLRDRGARVSILSPIERVEPGDWTEVDASLRSLSRYDWIVFTSRYGVSGLVDRADRIGVDRRDFNAARVAAVGLKTAFALQQCSIDVALTGDGSGAVGLAKAMVIAGVRGKRVLLARGDLAAGELPDHLRIAGASVDAVTVYRTVITPIEPHRYDSLFDSVDVVVVASASAIRSLVDQIGLEHRHLRGKQIVCIGGTTAAEVTRLGLDVAAVAARPSDEALMSTIESLYPVSGAS